MSETTPIYDSGAAPAPAATCPICSWLRLKPRTVIDGVTREEYEPLPTSDPLTALEREALGAAKEYDLAMEMVAIAQSDGDKETRLVARDNVTETKRAFRRAMANLGAPAAAGTGT